MQPELLYKYRKAVRDFLVAMNRRYGKSHSKQLKKLNRKIAIYERMSCK